MCSRADDPTMHDAAAPRAICKPGRHKYRRVALEPVVYADGSAITPSHESCARCGKVKQGSFDIH